MIVCIRLCLIHKILSFCNCRVAPLPRAGSSSPRMRTRSSWTLSTSLCPSSFLGASTRRRSTSRQGVMPCASAEWCFVCDNRSHMPVMSRHACVHCRWQPLCLTSAVMNRWLLGMHAWLGQGRPRLGLSRQRPVRLEQVHFVACSVACSVSKAVSPTHCLIHDGSCRR